MLGKSFDQWWPQLASGLQTVRRPATRRSMRTPDHLASETLQIVRSIQRDLKESRRSTGSSYAGPLPSFRVEYSFTNTDEALQREFISTMSSVTDRYGLVPVRPRDADHPTFVLFNIEKDLRKVIDGEIGRHLWDMGLEKEIIEIET
jgi:hypothetical protein